ncbi:MAG: D-sedoheptulose 7-phosphate isomerase [Planctomycetota bacterium]
MREKITEHLLKGAELRKKVAEKFADVIEEMARVIIDAFRSGHRLYIAGNGGSAADAQHIAGELVGRFRYDRAPLPAIALTTDTSVMTAIANDYGFDEIFLRQVKALVTKGDVFLAISTSGNSPNVLRAVDYAKKAGARVLALTGKDGGELARAAEKALVVPTEGTWDIQEIHITVGHILCGLIEETIFPEGEK